MLGAAASIFSIRRLIDLHKEVARRSAAEKEANKLARHDTLTGLPNRRHFLDQASKAIMDLSDDRERAIFIVDLDHFKPVNDVYGHRVGDGVLCEVARRLTAATEGEGLVARLGGDEFGILLPCVHDRGIAERIARRIVHDVSQPINVTGLSVKIGVSVGITLIASDLQDEDVLVDDELDEHRVHRCLRHADMAMYRAKTEGRSQYRFFEKDMDDKLKLHIQLEAELESAISAGEIVPFFQQLVDLGSNEVIGYEILARWCHPIHGILTPDVFIPIAEDTGLISKMTVSTLKRAIEEAKNWPGDILLSLNLSPRQLADAWLAQEILAVLAKTSFPPQRLEIEISESGLVERLDGLNGVLELLRNVGVRIALDDFGTGHSGLYHLRELGIDTIKIDRSFVTHLLSNHEEEKIVEAVINLSNSMGIATIAEGIETPEVLQRLMELGCKSGQGYYFGEPQDAAAMQEASSRAQIAARKNIA